MSKAKTEVKAMTLRQQMRAQAEVKLKELKSLVATAVERALEEADVEVNAYDVMRMCCGSQTKTVEAQLITDLANNAEAKLMKLWNDQQDLPMETPDANEKG